MNKYTIILLAALVLFIGFVTIESVWLKNNTDYMSFNAEPIDDSIYDESSYFDVSDYYAYVKEKPDTYPSEKLITVYGSDFESIDPSFQVLPEYEGVNDVLLTEEAGSVTWEVTVEEAGFYNLKLNYFPYEGKSSSAERALYINGEIPFEGSSNVTFHRIWSNDGEVIEDINGNEIRPSQIENPFWTTSFFTDHIGYVNDPYQFYFEAGLNTITLESLREPLLIKSIELVSVISHQSYDDYSTQYSGMSEVENTLEFVQGEDHTYSTSPTLYPLNDRTSPLTVPSDPNMVRLNTIGGNNWRISGDAITWEFEVTETGLYEISMRVKQKLASGMNVYRNIYINDEIPFEEMSNYAFEYSNDWRIQTLGTPDETYLFYFEAGVTNTITMEVSLGQYGPLIGKVQSAINNLNKLYREILIYTGPEPDPYRDYQLTERIDNLVERIEDEKVVLEEIKDQLILISGETSEKTGILQTVILQLDDFIDKPSEIHKNLLTYNSNISSLGTLVILLSAQPLEIDYFMFHSPEVELPRANETTLESLWFSIRSFIATFTTDYSSLGETD